MTVIDSSSAPESWVRPSTDQVDRAADFTVRALSGDGEWPVHGRLEAYYRRSGNYAGASFVSIAPNPARDITAADLHAVTLLAVDVDPRSTRRLLDPGSHRDSVLAALAALDDLGPVDLSAATSSVYEAMQAFAEAIKNAILRPDARDSNPWSRRRSCARVSDLACSRCETPQCALHWAYWECTSRGVIGSWTGRSTGNCSFIQRWHLVWRRRSSMR